MPPKPKRDDRDSEAPKVTIPSKSLPDVESVIRQCWDQQQRQRLVQPCTVITPDVMQRLLRSYNFSMEIENELRNCSSPDKTPTAERVPPHPALDSSVSSRTITSSRQSVYIETTPTNSAGDQPPWDEHYVHIDQSVATHMASPASTAASLDDTTALLTADYQVPSWRQSRSQCGHRAARAIFRWICSAVSYDSKGPTDAEGSFAARRADSQGFARLLEYMCRRSGIVEDCVFVPGFTRKGVDAAGAPDGVTQWYWNIITLEGRKYLVDACMAVGGSPYQVVSGPAMFENFYWGTPAQQFLNLHHPLDDAHQLLTPVTPKAVWGVRPCAGHIFYTHGLDFASHKTRMMAVCKVPPMNITLRNKLGVEVDFQISVRFGPCSGPVSTEAQPNYIPKNFFWTTREEHTQTVTFALTFPAIGMYSVDIHVARIVPGVKPVFQLATRYQVQLGAILVPEPLFPTQVLSPLSCRVWEPKYGKLLGNKDHKFVVVPASSTVSGVCVVNKVYAVAPARRVSRASLADPELLLGSTMSKSTTAKPQPNPPAGGPPPLAAAPSKATAVPKQEVQSIQANLLNFDPQGGYFVGTIRLLNGICDVYARIREQWELVVEGYQVVPVLPQREAQLNEGKPLMFVSNLERDTPYIHSLLSQAEEDTMKVLSHTAHIKQVGGYFESRTS